MLTAFGIALAIGAGLTIGFFGVLIVFALIGALLP